MSDLIRSGFQHLLVFVIVDTAGSELAGLGTTFTVEVSKNGADFAAGVGVKDEIGSGWYSYMLTVAETDTPGPLALRVTAAGAQQQNLLYEVYSYGSAPGYVGPDILSPAEAAVVLRCEDDDPDMLALLPLVDSYIKNATGRDWTVDAVIAPEAKSAARMLLVLWHEDPGRMASGETALGFGLSACLVQLEAMALSYKEFQGQYGAGACTLKGAEVGDTVVSLVGLIGATGDQSAAFETVITVKDHIQQIATGDLSANWYRAQLTRVGEL